MKMDQQKANCKLLCLTVAVVVDLNNYRMLLLGSNLKHCNDIREEFTWIKGFLLYSPQDADDSKKTMHVEAGNSREGDGGIPVQQASVTSRFKF